MSKSREILKIGAIISCNGQVLLVKKKGGTSYILPGGKPEPGETDFQALEREIREELGCKVDASSVSFIGEFRDAAADLTKTSVCVRLYYALIEGTPSAASEIDLLEWVSPSSTSESLAPSIRNSIFPFLVQHSFLQACAL